MENNHQATYEDVGVFVVDIPGGGVEAYYLEPSKATCAEEVVANGLFVATRYPDSPWLRFDAISYELCPVDPDFEASLLSGAVYVAPADPATYFSENHAELIEVDLDALCEAIDEMCSDSDEQMIDLHPSLFAVPPRGHYLH